MKSKIKTVCGLEKYEELSKRKGFLNQLRYYWFVLIASLRDIGKEETIKASAKYLQCSENCLKIRIQVIILISCQLLLSS